MTKAEIIEAIEAIIRPNGEKAITAESLANLLIEMANATPEGGSGSGTGALFLKMGESGEGVDMTEEDKENNKKIYEAGMNGTLGAVVYSTPGMSTTALCSFAFDENGEVSLIIVFPMSDLMIGGTGESITQLMVRVYQDGSVVFAE